MYHVRHHRYTVFSANMTRTPQRSGKMAVQYRQYTHTLTSHRQLNSQVYPNYKKLITGR